MESGVIVLVGATTENPSFELNAALLSRAQVLTLHRLGEAKMRNLLLRAEAAMGRTLPLTEEARATLIAMADGDGRALLNLAEDAFEIEGLTDAEGLCQRLTQRAPIYDKSGDGHYRLISALHKSVRGSDPDAALYWLCRMLTAGEDPMFIARRVVRICVEDIGLADPEALKTALAAKDAYHFLGSPEGELALAQAVVYAACAPKSNAAYIAYKAAMRAAKETGSLGPPKHSVNAPTSLMKKQGFAKGYEYDHDAEEGFSGQNHFPEEMARKSFYSPVERGFEREMAKRLAYFSRIRSSKTNGQR
jgi:putative ATPase